MSANEFVDVLRVTRGDETRIYRIRAGSGRPELWRFLEVPGEPTQSIKECDLANAEEAWTFLEEVQRTLRAGGWREGST